MSEAQKPVEEPVVASATETPVAEPVAETKPVEETAVPAVETTTESPAAVEPVPAATEEVAAPATEELKSIEEGVLGYKGPGLIKGFIFQKKHFWFGSEPVESKHLSNYLRGEKPETANHNAAWASHTGKGLLFFGKKASEKSSPAGIINLSEASDISTEGTTEFLFTTLNHKHTFQASTPTERDNWVSTLKSKIIEARDLKEQVTGSEAYKNTHGSLSKPVIAAAATGIPKKSAEVKKEDKAEAKEEKKEEKKEIKEEDKVDAKEEQKDEKKARKERSVSRKRNSIFGAIAGFGKKDEKTEPKEETPAVIAPEETAAPVETAAATETPAAPSVEPAAPVALAEETSATETKAVETKPVPVKRSSIFGTFFAPKEKKTEDAAPTVPAKDAEPVSETAPVIPAVEASQPLDTGASPSTVPAETTTLPATNGDAKAETPVVKNDKRKSSLPWLTKKEKATTSDDETEKPKSPFAKLRATVKGKTSAKVAEKATEKPTEEVNEPAKEVPAATEPTAEPVVADPVVAEPVSAAPASTPQVSATA